MPNLVSTHRIYEGHPDTLLYHCSDGRFTWACYDLMKSEGHNSYDILAVPGGSALLDMSSASIMDVETARSQLNFLIRSHSIQNVYFVAHTGCGYYRKRYNGQPDNVMIEKQIKDLRVSGAWFKQANPNIQLFLYLASPQEKRMLFEPVLFS